MLNGLNNIVNFLNGYIWGVGMLVLIVGSGLYFTIRLHGFQFVHFKDMWSRIIDKQDSDSGISAFGSFCTTMAMRVGTGNVAGVAVAIYMGGPGALFWMLLSGIIGLSTKLVESTLCVRYRVRDHKGKPVGGPMYVLQNAFPYRRMGRILAVLFAIFAVLASFGMGNMTQGNSIAEALAVTFGVDRTVTGLVIGIFTILVILGGIDKIARVTEYLVPCMAVFYLFGTGMVIFTHLHNLPAGILQILCGAFCPKAMAGGSIGFLCSGRQAMRYGVSRGVFSNEAGLGAAGISAACADTPDAVRQGYISMTGVFIDTIVICSLTGLAIASSGMLGQRDAQGELLNGTALMIAVFSATFGRAGEWMLALSIALFAFATIIAWEYQGGNSRRTGWYRLCYGMFAFLGAVCSLEAVWDFSDICNGLMAVPNLLAVVMLSKGICREIRTYKL